MKARAYQGSVFFGVLLVGAALAPGARAQVCNPFTFDKFCPTPDELTLCPPTGPSANNVTTIRCDTDFVQQNGQSVTVTGARCGTFA